MISEEIFDYITYEQYEAIFEQSPIFAIVEDVENVEDF